MTGVQTCALPISSITQSEEETRNWYGTTAKHAAITVALFLVWALLQATWVVGTSLRKDLDEADKAILVNEDKRRPFDSQLRILAAESNRLDESRKDAATTKRLQEISDLQIKVTEQASPIDQELNTLRNQREPLVQLLHGWYSTTTFRPGVMKSDTTIIELERQIEQLGKIDVTKKTYSLPTISNLRQITT